MQRDEKNVARIRNRTGTAAPIYIYRRRQNQTLNQCSHAASTLRKLKTIICFIFHTYSDKITK